MDNLQQQLKTLPRKPGIYQFKDAKGNLLYVGKAKILRNRVRSYFAATRINIPSTLPLTKGEKKRGSLLPAKDLDLAKTQMVPQIASIETISTDTETEALILEANLIRQHQPPYNVVLRDDKYYLFIKITTNEDFPRVFGVRRVKRDHARYFGPYSSAHAVRATLRLLRRLFPHQGEKESPRERIFQHPLFASEAKSAPRSPASRQGEVRLPKKQYQENITNIIHFLQSHRDEIMGTLRTGMQEASHAREFERAAIFRNQLQAIERLEGTQKVFLPTKETFDVISLARAAHRSAANVFQVRGGKLLGKQTFLLQHRSHASSADTLRQFILQYYSVTQDIPKKIYIPEKFGDQDLIARCLPRVASAKWGINTDTPPQFLVPQRGKKRQLLKMGELNAQQLLTQEEANFENETRLKKATQELFKAVLLAPPDKGGTGGSNWRVETYDISNIQGQLATASMVVFENGKPAPKEYRKFKLKLSGQPNDFAMLQEALRRRFSGRHPDWKTPDLIIIDGGKGQLSSAKKVLSELNITVPIIALAKREEEIFTIGNPAPILLPYDSDARYLIQRMRDEAHRFTITYHKLLRSQRATRSVLDDIPGIGPKTKRQLLNRFGSLKGIRAAEPVKLENVIGSAKTAILRDYL